MLLQFLLYPVMIAYQCDLELSSENVGLLGLTRNEESSASSGVLDDIILRAKFVSIFLSPNFVISFIF